MSLKDLALDLAHKYHDGQFRWDGATPYVVHPIAVSENFTDENYIATALLHDVIEDCNVRALDLLDLGIPDDVVSAVVLLTRSHGQDYLNYILNIRSNEMARQVKIADIEYNIKFLPDGQRKEKYRMALYILKLEK